jgi:hypothetical protein
MIFSTIITALKDLQVEYKVQIIAIFSGAFIAILSAFIAYLFSIRQADKKEKCVYLKNLSIIDSNIDWQLNQITRLESSLLLLHKTSLSDGQISISEFPTTFNTKILQNSINNLTEYKESNETLLKTLIFYLNHIEDFNHQLEFENANTIITTLDDKDGVEAGINDFFASLKEDYIEKIRLSLL